MNDNDLDAELDAYLDDYDDRDLAALPVFETRSAAGDLSSRRVVLDEPRVAALLSKRQRLLDEEQRARQRAEERIAPIQAWLDDRTAGIVQQVEWIDRNLEQYARTALPEMGRRSLPLPAGTLKLTAAGAASVDVIDEGEFVAWAIDDEFPERDELLRRKVEVEKAELKRRVHLGPRDDDLSTDERHVYAAVDGNGERIPGVRLSKPAHDRFTVTAPVQNQSDEPDDTTQGD